MKKAVVREFAKATALYLPSAKLTTDNAAMIGAVGNLPPLNHNFPIYFFNELYIVYTYHPFCQALLNPYFSAKMAL